MIWNMHETIFVVHKQLCVQRDSPAVGRCNLVFFVKVFFLLNIHLLRVHNKIWADVDYTPLSNFKYSRQRPRWSPQRTKKIQKSHLSAVFCHNSPGKKSRFWAEPRFVVCAMFFDGFTLFRGC